MAAFCCVSLTRSRSLFVLCAACRYQRAADEAAVAETRAKYATRIDELGAVLLELALW